MTTTPAAGRLYVVATSHLDTQWRWTVRDTIERFLPATLAENFRLFEKYPYYVLSFEGSFRYRLIREYYPREWERLREYVNAGRWRPAGSMVDAPDVNIVSPESLLRQILYGQRFFERELGAPCADIFLPDCFGFTWALPSVAAHCGVKGFSSQKLVRWKKPGKVPFDLGLWEGPDGARVLCVLDPGGYGSKIEENLAKEGEWPERVARRGSEIGLPLAYRYFGVGDRGGAPGEESVQLLGEALDTESGPRVIHAGSGRMFRDLQPSEIDRLPVHRGELQIPTHGTGCWSSQAAMKRWNRRCEYLAGAAERAASLASWLGACDYPDQQLREAWEGFLWHQMHDDLTGTSIPRAYELSWNDQLLALNRFSTVLTDSVAAAARGLDTSVEDGGIPLVVYNPLGVAREDPVEARIRFDSGVPERVRVVGPDGDEAPCQVIARSAKQDRSDTLDLLFLAKVPAVSLSVYRVVLDGPAASGESAKPEGSTASGRGRESEVSAVSASAVSESGSSGAGASLENRRYRVQVSETGEVVSIFDKELRREVLSAPASVQLLPDLSRRWPAWEMRYKDVQAKPRPWFKAGRRCSLTVEENGPVRATLRIESRVKGSTLVQRLRLYGGEGRGGNRSSGPASRLEWHCDLDWRTRRRILKAAFPIALENETASYDLGLGVIERGTNTRERYETPAQRWADLSTAEARGNSAESPEAGWGVSILTNSLYGWDKPNGNTLRHTLLRSPLARHHFRHQRSQDLGPHDFAYALYSHAASWSEAETAAQAERFNQPLLAFQTNAAPEQSADLRRQVSFFAGPKEGVELMALKRAEDPAGDEHDWIVRLLETRGTGTTTECRLGEGIVAAREIDGREKARGPAETRESALRLDLGPFQPRSFAAKLTPPRTPLSRLSQQALDLPWNTASASFHGQTDPPDFDGQGNALPGELMPSKITSGEITFRLGQTGEPGGKPAPNCVACEGQQLQIPEGTDTLYLLTASAAPGGEETAFQLGHQSQTLTIHPYSGFIGQNTRWRQYRGWKLGPEQPRFIIRTPVAWVATHRHGTAEDGSVTDQPYLFCYLFRQELAVPPGTRTLTLPQTSSVRIFAATAAKRDGAALQPARPLYT